MAHRTVETEEFYDIIENENGDLLFTLKVREGEPESPRVLYDGGENALLYRTGASAVMLDYIHPGAREKLGSASQVLMVEFDEESPVREYVANVRHVSRLPADTAE